MISNFVWLILVFIISAIPLNIAVKLLGGHSGLIKTALVNVIAGLIMIGARQYVPMFGTIVGFVGTLLVYKFAFGLGFIRAILAMILEGVIVFFFFMLFAILIGVTLFI